MDKVETDLEIAQRIDDEAESFMPTMAMMLMGCSHSAKLVVATKLSATLIALAVQGKREDVDGLISMFEVACAARSTASGTRFRKRPLLSK